MANLGLLLLCFALVFAIIATRWWTIGVWNLVALAIAFWIASELLGGLSRSGLLH
jgi:hypothetical protein